MKTPVITADLWDLTVYLPSVKLTEGKVLITASKKKKILAIFGLTVPVIAASVAVYMAFAGKPVITVGSTEAAVGETVAVPVKISGNRGISTVGLKIGFDNAYLEPVSAEQSELLNGGLFVENISTAKQPLNSVNITYSNAENFKGNGVMYTAYFKVIQEIPGSMPLELSLGRANVSDEDLEFVECKLKNGSVSNK
ncbi:MAG: hypothetical protein LBR54_03520 [Oscillospiraceae bacterium]|jgi:hypothetical protein|nr:hypothetical protein [Oscillospiraceae bacterium]